MSNGNHHPIFFGSNGFGIGTQSPLGTLEVSGTAIFGGTNLALSNISYLTGTGKLLIGSNRSGSRGETNFISNQGGGSSGGFGFHNLNNSGIETQLMYISSGGNVGIGTTAPTEKLTVNGKIRAREIRVDAQDMPDYVFEKDYKITTLEELESYIKEKKHLPEITGAIEAEKNGLELGEMNKLLLKKVEEFTLYIIQEHKLNLERDGLFDAQRLKIFELEKN
ncbi:hypothetical protein [Pedobacter sp. P26]|uniref:hypothetical protein n=1 Tax=Pedobacter sp. P26 TaxID=3423956 RepID=UPI003D667823